MIRLILFLILLSGCNPSKQRTLDISPVITEVDRSEEIKNGFVPTENGYLDLNKNVKVEYNGEFQIERPISPKLVFSYDKLDLGVIGPNQYATYRIALKNIGSETAKEINLLIPKEYKVEKNNCHGNLATEEYCAFTMTILGSRLKQGQYMFSVSATDKKNNLGFMDVAVEFGQNSPAKISTSDEILNFSSKEKEVVKNLMVNNLGRGVIEGFRVISTSEDFVVIKNGCSRTSLAMEQSCVISIMMDNDVESLKTGKLIISAKNVDSKKVVSLTNLRGETKINIAGPNKSQVKGFIDPSLKTSKIEEQLVAPILDADIPEITLNKKEDVEAIKKEAIQKEYESKIKDLLSKQEELDKKLKDLNKSSIAEILDDKVSKVISKKEEKKARLKKLADDKKRNKEEKDLANKKRTEEESNLLNQLIISKLAKDAAEKEAIANLALAQQKLKNKEEELKLKKENLKKELELVKSKEKERLKKEELDLAKAKQKQEELRLEKEKLEKALALAKAKEKEELDKLAESQKLEEENKAKAKIELENKKIEEERLLAEEAIAKSNELKEKQKIEAETKAKAESERIAKEKKLQEEKTLALAKEAEEIERKKLEAEAQAKLELSLKAAKEAELKLARDKELLESERLKNIRIQQEIEDKAREEKENYEKMLANEKIKKELEEIERLKAELLEKENKEKLLLARRSSLLETVKITIPKVSTDYKKESLELSKAIEEEKISILSQELKKRDLEEKEKVDKELKKYLKSELDKFESELALKDEIESKTIETPISPILTTEVVDSSEEILAPMESEDLAAMEAIEPAPTAPIEKDSEVIPLPDKIDISSENEVIFEKKEFKPIEYNKEFVRISTKEPIVYTSFLKEEFKIIKSPLIKAENLLDFIPATTKISNSVKKPSKSKSLVYNEGIPYKSISDKNSWVLSMNYQGPCEIIGDLSTRSCNENFSVNKKEIINSKKIQAKVKENYSEVIPSTKYETTMVSSVFVPTDKPIKPASLNEEVFFPGKIIEGQLKLFKLSGGHIFQVSDSNKGFNDYPENITVLGNRLYMTSQNTASQNKLFSVDENYLTQLSNIMSFSNDNIYPLGTHKGKLFLKGLNTEGATSLMTIEDSKLKELVNLKYIKDFLSVGDSIYLTAGDNYNLFRYSDKKVEQITNFQVQELSTFDNKVFFNGKTKEGESLFSFDGKKLVEYAVKNPSDMTVFNKELWMVAEVGGYRKLVAYNNASFVVKSNFRSGHDFAIDYDKKRSELIEFNKELYFIAKNKNNGFKIFKTSNGLEFMEVSAVNSVDSKLNPTGSDFPFNLFIYDNKLYFSAYSNSNGLKLFYLSKEEYN